MKKEMNRVMDSLVDVVIQTTEHVNISNSERIVSTVAGGFMVWKGLKDTFSSPSSAFIEIVFGSALLYRGVTGYCSIKNRLDNPPEEKPKAYLIEAM